MADITLHKLLTIWKEDRPTPLGFFTDMDDNVITAHYALDRDFDIFLGESDIMVDEIENYKYKIYNSDELYETFNLLKKAFIERWLYKGSMSFELQRNGDKYRLNNELYIENLEDIPRSLNAMIHNYRGYQALPRNDEFLHQHITFALLEHLDDIIFRYTIPMINQNTNELICGNSSLSIPVVERVGKLKFKPYVEQTSFKTPREADLKLKELVEIFKTKLMGDRYVIPHRVILEPDSDF